MGDIIGYVKFSQLVMFLHLSGWDGKVWLQHQGQWIPTEIADKSVSWKAHGGGVWEHFTDNTLIGTSTAEGRICHSRNPSHPTPIVRALSLHNDLEFPQTNRTHQTSQRGKRQQNHP